MADNTITESDQPLVVDDEKKDEDHEMVMMIDTRSAETKLREDAEIVVEEVQKLLPEGDQFTGSGHVIKGNLDSLFV